MVLDIREHEHTTATNAPIDYTACGAYLRTIYESGNVPPPEARPNFGPYQEAITNAENTARGSKGNLVVIRNKINQLLETFPPLATAMRGETLQDQARDGETAEDDFRFLDFKDLMTLPKPEWLVYDILPTKGVNFIFGKPGCGKTFVAIGMACSVAMQISGNRAENALYEDALNWCGRATKHGHVIYIAAEDIDEVAQRAIAWSKHYGVSDIPNIHFFPCSLDLAKDTPRFMEALNRQYGTIDIALFVVDTLAMCSLSIDENSKKEFDAVIHSLETLWRTYTCCVAVIHHAGKNGEMRGTSSMDAVAYSMIQVAEEDENIVLKSIKKRRGKKFEDVYLDRAIIETGTLDENGEPATTCVLVKSDRQAATDPSRLSPLQQTIIEHMKNLGRKNVARSELMKACMVDKSQEKSFINATSGLIGKGLITSQKLRQRTSYTIIEPCKGDENEG